MYVLNLIYTIGSLFMFSIAFIRQEIKPQIMKKIILSVSGILLIATMYVGIDSYINHNSLDKMLLTNVEALAQNGEAGQEALCIAPFDQLCMTIYPNGTPWDIPGTFNNH